MSHQRLRGSLLATAVLLGATGASLRAQDFEGVVTAKLKSMSSGDMKTFLKDGKTRVEMTMQGNTFAMIVDPAAGESYIVLPAQSMVMVMKLSDAEKMADSLVRRTADASVTATGKKETIVGHSCEYYRMKSEKSAVDVCLASGLGSFGGAASIFGGPPTPGRPPAAPPAWAKDMLRKGMFPLKVSDTLGVMIWEVVALEKKPLDASLFVPPADYRRMNMPSFGRPPGS
jgi:hypothetical protein